MIQTKIFIPQIILGDFFKLARGPKGSQLKKLILLRKIKLYLHGDNISD